MQTYVEALAELCRSAGLPPQYAGDAALLLSAAAFALAIFVVQRALKWTLTAVARVWAKRSRNTWDDAFCEAHFPSRAAHLFAAVLSVRLFGAIFEEGTRLFEIFRAATGVYFAVAVAGTVFAALGALMIVGMNDKRFKDVPIKGFFQALKILVALGAAVWVLSILSDKSPAYFLSGLGALMAILLIVFKDALLGFTAGVMISANDLVRNKDWIEIQSMGVDGEVFDVSLTTVKVRNWDNTIANVPAYHFASEDEIARWRKIELLKPYLTRKLEEISAANARVPAEASGVPANVRMLTNLGTFRAYCMAYLKANKRIHQGMTMLVRQLDPGPTGLPLEIYVFTNDTRWANYEDIQSDIFDHLLAVISEFGLAPYQEPSGRNFEGALALAGRSRRA